MSLFDLLFTTTLLFAPPPAGTLTAGPGPQSTEPGQPQTPQTPQAPPVAPPSRIDPGIQKAPDTVPTPKSLVPPPVVDPKMAIDQERPGGPGSPAPPSMPDKLPTPQR